MKSWKLSATRRGEMSRALLQLRLWTMDENDAEDMLPLLGLDGAAIKETLLALRKTHDPWRILTCRVAIALRAALRADDEALCAENRRDRRRRRRWPLLRTQDDVRVPLAAWEPIDDRRAL